VEDREAVQWEIVGSLQSDQGSSQLEIVAQVTYFQKEKALERKFLGRFKYNDVVIDTTHVLKNAQRNRFKTSIRSSHRRLLKGTPVQVCWK
jgi:hypothetical protein